jgi:ASCH domain
MALDQARVLTIRQPWAWAIIHGGKDVENRSWFTNHRGPLLIHAGSAFEPDGYEKVKQLASQPPPPPSDFVHGAIIGVVELVDCLLDFQSEWAVARRWHWHLRDPQPLDEAVRCPGKLGLWRPPPGVLW